MRRGSLLGLIQAAVALAALPFSNFERHVNDPQPRRQRPRRVFTYFRYQQWAEKCQRKENTRYRNRVRRRMARASRRRNRR